MPRYVPILKGRQGELNALKDVGLATRSAIVPLIEVVPPSEESAADAVGKACKDAATKLADRYSGLPLMLDAGLFDLSAPPGSQTAVGVLADWARSTGLEAQPVVRLGDPKAAHVDAGRANEQDGRGLAMRLVGDDVDEDAEDVDAALDAVLAAAGVDRPSVDLILDLGAVDGDIAVRGGASLVRALLRGLERVDEWRSVTIAAGAFPLDLSQFTPDVIGERPRFDAQLFDAVRSKRLPRDVDYADYAIAHPVLATGPGYPPPPQLRYTTADNWLVLKGRRNDPRGNAQFQKICQIIAQRPDFVGARLGRADARIANGSQEGPGNGTTWRAIGTTHHVDFVAARLTTLGEP
jgi:hypothetical protein